MQNAECRMQNDDMTIKTQILPSCFYRLGDLSALATEETLLPLALAKRFGGTRRRSIVVLGSYILHSAFYILHFLLRSATVPWFPPN